MRSQRRPGKGRIEKGLETDKKRAEIHNQMNDSSKIPTEDEVLRLAKSGDRRSAVEMYRLLHEAGVKEALDAIEKLLGLPPRHEPIGNVPLSPETRLRLEVLFKPDTWAEATRLLVEQCGNNLPGHEQENEISLERIRFAVLKLSGGDMANLRQEIKSAKIDWRDSLVAAGFGNDTTAHQRWVPS
jgi:hypothetical protein